MDCIFQNRENRQPVIVLQLILLKGKQMKNLLKLILPSIASVLLSILIFNYLLEYFGSQTIASSIQNEFTLSSKIIMFVTCFSYCFSSLSLPFFFSVFFESLKLSSISIAKFVLFLELIGLAIAIFFFPPGLLSKIIWVVLWQLPVISNTSMILYKRKTS